jgi:hypothetical protein
MSGSALTGATASQSLVNPCGVRRRPHEAADLLSEPASVDCVGRSMATNLLGKQSACGIRCVNL